MNLKTLLLDFNISRCMLASCGLATAVLLPFWLDGLAAPLWLPLAPLLTCHCLAVLASVVGTIVWCLYPRSRSEGGGRSEFRAMLVTAALHLLLLLFGLALCTYPGIQDKGFRREPLEAEKSSGKPPWLLVFAPLFVVCPLGLAGCVWGLRHGRAQQLEMIFGVNFLQFVFIALRLDGVINWAWVVVCIPAWLLLSFLELLSIYHLLWAFLIASTTAAVTDGQRRSHMLSACTHVTLLTCLLTFLALLTAKVDEQLSLNFVFIFIPLWIGLLAVLLSSCCLRGGNRWWFGLRQSFCPFLLDMFPCLREFTNVGYSWHDPSNETNDDSELVAVQPTVPALQKPLASPDGAWTVVAGSGSLGSFRDPGIFPPRLFLDIPD
uniref:transmembrane protein 185-like n=1 Tax=Myxine glutinosa TaxID=7769 RepID=UPI00358E4D6D